MKTTFLNTSSAKIFICFAFFTLSLHCAIAAEKSDSSSWEPAKFIMASSHDAQETDLQETTLNQQDLNKEGWRRLDFLSPRTIFDNETDLL